MNMISIPKKEWDEGLQKLLSSFDLFAPVENGFSSDYAKLNTGSIPHIIYNRPKPVTPLKNFFLPVKENVTTQDPETLPRVVLGVPNCDIMALRLLDEIYLDEEYHDPAYGLRRERTTLVSFDCFSAQEHCHCTSYGIDPAGNEHSDLSAAMIGQEVIVTVHGEKGKGLLEKMGLDGQNPPEKEQLRALENKRKEVKQLLSTQNSNLPDYEQTGHLIQVNGEASWKKHSADCVSCGACSAICPSCSCFLLIDRPGFQKVRQLDTCQYPGFERVAGGEDALGPLPERFKHRYLCKFVWKPQNYGLKACTGCGRCIETCIGQINKNELFMELSK